MSYYNLINKVTDFWKATLTWFASIRNLILFFVISFIGILILISGVIIVQNNTLKNYSDRIASYEFPIATVASNLNSDLNRQAFSLRGNIIRKDTAWQYERDDRWEQQMFPDLQRLLDAKEFFTEESTKQNFDSLSKYLKEYHQMEEATNDWLFRYYVLSNTTFHAGDSSTLGLPRIEDLEKNELIPLTKTLSSLQGRVRRYLEPIMAENQKIMTDDIHKINDRLYYSSLFIGILSFISIALASVLGYYLVNKVKRNINKPVDLLRHLMVGATSENVEPTNDELGEIIKASNKLSENLRKASEFAENIGEGNFDYGFEPVSHQDILGNALVKMRKQLKTISEEDKKRNWTTTGLAHFGEMFRQATDLREMANKVISELVSYVHANQGSLFILNDDNPDHKYLELIGCYAYNRVKYQEKKIEFGQGLAGQCYLEKESIYLIDIPENYIAITSGLGEATPGCLLIVPLKLNDEVEGVIELATFQPFEDFEVEFIEKVAESITSSISNAKVNYRTKKLLHETQQNTEELRAQEEEMRQNMEELQATQEDLQRKNLEFTKIQEQLELEKGMFHILLDYIPDRVTFKDETSKIIRVNRAKAKKMNLTPEYFIGKSDYDFFSKEHAEKAIQEEREIIREGKPLLNITEELVYNDGEKSWVTTSRIPFYNTKGVVTGMFIISKDETEFRKLQLQFDDQRRMMESFSANLQVIMYKVKPNENFELEFGNLQLIGITDEQVKTSSFYNLFGLDRHQVEQNVEFNFTFESHFANITASHHLFEDKTIKGGLIGYAQVTSV